MFDATVMKSGISPSPSDWRRGMAVVRGPRNFNTAQQSDVSFGAGSTTRFGPSGSSIQNINVTTINENHEYHQHWDDSSKLLYDCVNSLLSKMDALTVEISELRNAKTFVVPITTLANEPLQMKLNIPATIEGDGEEFTATFYEANVSASGDTAADAIANLKESLISSYEFFESLREDELGPLPARQWAVLRNVLAR